MSKLDLTFELRDTSLGGLSELMRHLQNFDTAKDAFELESEINEALYQLVQIHSVSATENGAGGAGGGSGSNGGGGGGGGGAVVVGTNSVAGPGSFLSWDGGAGGLEGSFLGAVSETSYLN